MMTTTQPPTHPIPARPYTELNAELLARREARAAGRDEALPSRRRIADALDRLDRGEVAP